MSEADLADPDSRFKVLNEVAVHYKVANGAAGGAPKLAVAMYHVGNPRMLDASQRALSHIPTTIDLFIIWPRVSAPTPSAGHSSTSCWPRTCRPSLPRMTCQALASPKGELQTLSPCFIVIRPLLWWV